MNARPAAPEPQNRTIHIMGTAWICILFTVFECHLVGLASLIFFPIIGCFWAEAREAKKKRFGSKHCHLPPIAHQIGDGYVEWTPSHLQYRPSSCVWSWLHSSPPHENNVPLYSWQCHGNGKRKRFYILSHTLQDITTHIGIGCSLRLNGS